MSSSRSVVGFLKFCLGCFAVAGGFIACADSSPEREVIGEHASALSAVDGGMDAGVDAGYTVASAPVLDAAFDAGSARLAPAVPADKDQDDDGTTYTVLGEPDFGTAQPVVTAARRVQAAPAMLSAPIQLAAANPTPYTFEVTTCPAGPRPPTLRAALTVQTASGAAGWLITPGAVGKTGVYAFAWPTASAPKPETLEAIKLEIDFAPTAPRDWCISSAALKFNGQALWSWAGEQQLDGPYLAGFPLSGPITLSADPAKPLQRFIRFTQTTKTVSIPNGYLPTTYPREFSFTDCGTGTTAEAPDLRVSVRHDGLTDFFPLSRGVSLGKHIPGRNNWFGLVSLEGVQVAKWNTDPDWKVCSAAYYTPAQGSSPVVTFWSWSDANGYLLTDKAGGAVSLVGDSDVLTFNVSQRKEDTCKSNCVTVKQGFALVKDARVQQCIAGTNPPDTSCNGVDDDCDGSVDEEWVPPCKGECAVKATCINGVGKCGTPVAEISSNKKDEDCNGTADDEATVYSCTDKADNNVNGLVDCADSSCVPVDFACRAPVAAACSADTKCNAGLVCLNGKCQAPACDNGIKDVGETGIDCGGPCPACAGTECGDTCRIGTPSTPAPSDTLHFSNGTFTRSSRATYESSPGVLETAFPNELRWVSVDGHRMALFEGATTNTLKWTGDLDRAPDWTISPTAPMTMTANAETAPDGSSTAERFTSSAPGQTPFQNVTLSAGAWTLSAYARAAVSDKSGLARPFITSTADNSVLSSATENFDRRWRRIDVPVAVTASTATSVRLSNVPGWPTSDVEGIDPSAFALWGLQLESRPFPTSYVASSSVPLNRVADVLTYPKDKCPSWLAHGTWQMDVQPLYASAEIDDKTYTLLTFSSTMGLGFVRSSTSSGAAQLMVRLSSSIFNSVDLVWDRGAVLRLTVDAQHDQLTIAGAASGNGVYPVPNLEFTEAPIRIGGDLQGVGESAFAAMSEPRKVSGATETCQADASCNCAGKTCDPSKTTLCSQECKPLTTPITCKNDSECPNGQNCLSGVAAHFGLPASTLVCAPPICPSTDPALCGSPTSVCGTCQCTPQCANKKCGDDLSDGCGGLCTGLCGIDQVGCHDDRECPSTQFCWIGQAWRFDSSAPPNANICADLSCDDSDPRRIDCGTKDSPCGFCDPNVLSQCLLGPLCKPNGDVACGPGQHKNKVWSCIDDEDDTPIIDDVNTVSVGALPGSFDVTGGASAHYSIPINVPPGRGGLAPSLSISYDSSRGNSMLGLGWGLDGLSMIRICPKTVAQDGYLSNSVGLCFNGSRIVPVHYDSTRDVTEWRTEFDTFIKIECAGDWYNPGVKNGYFIGEFFAFTKDGLRLRFGTDIEGESHAYSPSDARLDTTTDIYLDDNRMVHSSAWAISEIRDRAGNRVEFAYSNLSRGNVQGWPAESELLPRWIGYNFAGDPGQKYTGGPDQRKALNEVVFVYDGEGTKVPKSCKNPATEGCSGFRPDPLRGYSSGALQEHSRLLGNVSVIAGGKPVRTYHLHPKLTENDLSTVDHITECAHDVAGAEHCRPATKFEYNPFALGAQSKLDSTLGSDSIKYVLDWNGDGRDDVAEWIADPGKLVIHLATGPHSWTAQAQEYKFPDSPPDDPRAKVVDIDGDGADELMFTMTEDIAASDRDNTLFQNGKAPRRLSYSHYSDDPQPGDIGYDEFTFADFDGDGLKDLLGCDLYLWVHINDGNGGFRKGVKVAGAAGIDHCYEMVTVNDSNGRESVVVQGSCSDPDHCDTPIHKLVTRTIPLWNGYDIGGTVHVRVPPQYAALPINGITKGPFELYGPDVNGDGLTDLLLLGEDGSAEWWINHGSMRILENNAGVADMFSRGGRITFAQERKYMGDFKIVDDDGDGRSDLSWYVLSNDDTDKHYRVTHGRSQYTDKNGASNPLLFTDGLLVADLDGDGSKDFIDLNSKTVAGGFSPAAGLLSTVRIANSNEGVPRTVKVSYQSGLAAGVYATTDACKKPAEDHSRCLRKLTSPVVSSYAMDTYDQKAGTPTSTQHREASYRYEDARFLRAGRGWLGFATRTTTTKGFGGADTVVMKETYDRRMLDLGKSGPFYAHDPALQASDYSYVIFPALGTPTTSTSITRVTGSPKNPIVTSKDVFRKTEITREFETVTSDRDLRFANVHTETFSIYESTSTKVPYKLIQQTKRRIHRDVFGNPIIIYDDFVDQNRWQHTDYHYAWQDDQKRIENWQVDLASQVTRVSKDAATNYSFVDDQKYLYDDAGLLTHVTVNPDRIGDERKITISHEDPWHNATSVLIEGGVRVGGDATPPPPSRFWMLDYGKYGVSLQFTQNPEGHPRTVKTSLGDGLVRSVLDANQVLTTWRYDGFGRPISQHQVTAGISTTYSYSSATNVATTVLDTNGELLVTTIVTADGSPQSNSVTELYDPDGRPVYRTSKGYAQNDVVSQEFQFDQFGRLAKASRPHLSGDTSQSFSTLTYDEMGRVIKTVGADSAVNETYFASIVTVKPELASKRADARWYTQSKDANVKTKTWTSDFEQNVIEASEEYGTLTSYTYGPDGFLVRTKDPLGNLTTATPDDLGAS